MDSLEEREISWVFDVQTETAEDPLAMHIKIETDEPSRSVSEVIENMKSEPLSPFANWAADMSSSSGQMKQEEVMIKEEIVEGVEGVEGLEVIEADRHWVTTDQFSSLYRAIFGADHGGGGPYVGSAFDGAAGGMVDFSQSGCRCRTCNNAFPNMVNLYGHSCLIGNGDGHCARKVYVYLCKVCGKFFTAHALLKEHLLRHSSFATATNRRVETCYKLLQYRRKHIRFCVFLCRRDARSDRIRRKCNFCQEVIVSSRKNAINFDRGIRQLITQATETCYICNAVIVCVTPDCNEAHQSFTRSNNTMHGNEICKLCNKSYNITWHLRMHNEESLYYCHF